MADGVEEAATHHSAPFYGCPLWIDSSRLLGMLQDEVGEDPPLRGCVFVAYPSLPSDRAESIGK